MWIWAIVIISSIWVYFDAKSLGMGGSKKEYTDEDLNREDGQEFGAEDNKSSGTGPVGWLLVCLLLWIVGFPAYLYSRSKFKKKLREATEKTCPFCAEKIKAAAVICKHCGKSLSLTDV